MIELYAISAHPGPPLPDLAPLFEVPSRGLAGICAPAEDGDPTPERLWRHEAVLEALMADRDLLPVRYGTRVPDAGAVECALEDRHEELTVALDRVRGAVELAVRVVSADPPPPMEREGAPSNGAEYLRAQARLAGAEEDTVRAVHEPLLAIARDGAVKRPSTPGELLRAAYLLDRDGVDAFVDRVETLERDRPALRLSCTGPWPPYSFARR